MVALGLQVNIQELLRDGTRRRFAAQPEVDALTEQGALQEAQLLDVHVDVLRSSAYLLFDCRGALQIEMGNTAIIAVYGLEGISWSGLSMGPRTAWTVVTWGPNPGFSHWVLSVEFTPLARLELAAAGAEFYVGNVPGCDGPPPDYMDVDDNTLRASLANWLSDFEPVHAIFLNL